MNLLTRLWLALRGGTPYTELDSKGQWATWQQPDEKDERAGRPEDDVRKLDDRGD